MISRKMAVVLGIIGIFGLITVYGCATQPGAAAVPAEQGAVPAEKSPDIASMYKAKVKPLTTAECGQCHLPIYETVKAQGSKHQIDCVRCHTKYHVYSPRKQNYDQIMPKCSSCHLSASGGPFHGEHKNLTPCLNCHADPHKPLVIPAAEIEASCGFCHSKEGNEIKQYPSRHTTEVACADCHAERHGYIPECSVCHESHSPRVELATAQCMTCHPVHKPTQITYSVDTESLICAGCHDEVNDMLQKKVTKHTAVACADCHPTHKEIPPCSRCHGEPHPKTMMKNVSNCGDCHGIAHDLAT